MKRTRSTATKVNTIRPQQFGEPASYGRSLEPVVQPARAQETEVRAGDAGVVGGSRSGKGYPVNAGELSGQDAREEPGHPAAVRAAIVAKKPGNAGGAKGGRKANASNKGRPEATPSISSQ